MKKYNLINNALGWLCFVVAAVTYLLTIEPTASFWDCPEFISQGAKLEVGHPPGNPIFMLTARFFVTLFGNDITSAAVAVNSMSALLSAATILLLFWTVTHLVRRLIVRDDELESIPAWKMWLIMGGGICGALAYTWSDTFWFSAVEGEVYAFSSFCTALVVWLMLKWENRADQPHSDRYLVLIAYVIGVSIAVHLLNLLCIPALGLIFYYRKSKAVDAKGSLIALLISCVIVGAILYGLVPGFVKVSQWFELLCVNSLGMSYNMGVLIYAIVLVAAFIWAVFELDRQKSAGAIRLSFFVSMLLSGILFIGHSAWLGVLLTLALAVYLWGFCRKIPVRVFNVVVLSVFVIFIGYSSYALLLIRASANTPMNQNAPDNVFALASYLNREQYGDRPLFKGTAFAEEVMTEEYPQGSGNYFVLVDEYGRPRTRYLDGYLRDENGGAYNTPEMVMTKVVKTSPDEPDRYVEEVERPHYRTNPDMDMLFTRIYSIDPQNGYAHVNAYKAWAGYSTPDINTIPLAKRNEWRAQGYAPLGEVMPYLTSLTPVTTAVDGNNNPVAQTAVWKPGFDVNLRYFVNYQLNHMYWRYFMWNFAGRQNDFQGNGEPHLGNWISGIPAIDNARLGDQSMLPDEYGKGNKGHNVFYMMPLILGLIGLLYQALYRHRENPARGIEQFWVVFFLFFMTGIAIVLYLNQTPGQPRERDYAFAGSFYAYAIWIGMGVPAIGIMLRNLFRPKAKNAEAVEEEPSKGATMACVAVACAVGLIVPVQMVSQTWDDHDRSGRYAARDFGMNYLSSLDENAIIFTNGDNDTFPLWYAQEVEGYRTDVRVVNLSYLTTDWYANQLKHPTYEADAVPMYAQPKDYAYERLGWSFVVPRSGDYTNAAEALKSLYASDAKIYGAPYIETPKIVMPVDREAAMARYGTGNAMYDSLYVAPYLTDIRTDLGSSGLNQSKTLSLDIIANSVAGNWNRPVYFATTVPTSYYLGLSPYLATTGLAYEVTPFADAVAEVTAEKAFANILGKFRWGGLDAADSDKLYLDETVRRMVASIRSAMFTTVENLLATADVPASPEARKLAVEAGYAEPQTRADMARIVMDVIQTKLPARAAAYEGLLGIYMAQAYTDLYAQSGNPEDLAKADALLDAEAPRYAQLLRYGISLPADKLSSLGRSELYGMQYLSTVVGLKNRIALLKAAAAQNSEIPAAITALTLDDDLRLTPLIYIQGVTLDELEKNFDTFDEREQRLVAKAIDLLTYHELLDVPQMQYSEKIMQDFGISPQAWNHILNY